VSAHKRNIGRSESVEFPDLLSLAGSASNRGCWTEQRSSQRSRLETLNARSYQDNCPPL